MEIEKILKDNEFEIVGKKNISYKEKKISYIEVVYKFNKKFFAKYIIFNLLSENENRNEVEEIITDDFHDFQIKLLSDIYFDMPGDTRYNLYLIFLVEEQSRLLSDAQLQQDFYYARKLVLARKEIKNYFTRELFKRHQVDNGQWYENEKEEELFLAQEAEEIFRLLLRAWIIVGGSMEKVNDGNIQKFLDIYNRCQILKRGMLYKKNEKDYKHNESYPRERFRIVKILSAEIKNFRCFKEEVNINFNRVNLIYGENGAGKTSLLEALEWALTGENRNKEQEAEKSLVVAKCTNQRGRPELFSSQDVKIELAEDWYGRKVNSKEAFNDLFNKYNYFDTKGASSFAIEGLEKINIQQMRNFLGVEFLFNLIDMKTEMIRICSEMIQLLEQQKSRKSKMRVGLRIISIKPRDKERLIKEFEKEKIKLEKHEMRNIGEIREKSMNAHIAKIEEIFKMLVCTYEYSRLEILNNEVVGIKSADGEAVPMFKMSTGQKVCLALSFMFALSLSSENSPHIIMLDEPVANLDDIHMLNLLDVLRRFSVNDTQIFFTTANPDVAKLFRRKFSFLEDGFGFYRITETQNNMKITRETYNLEKEEPIKVVEIYNMDKG